MKKLMLSFFVLISVAVFIYQTQAVKRRLDAKKVTQKSSETPSDIKVKASEKSKQTATKPMPLVSKKLSTKYDKINQKFTPWFDSNPSVMNQLLSNPKLPLLFKSNEPLFGFYGPKFDMLEMYLNHSEMDGEKKKILVSGYSRLHNTICKVSGYFTLESAGVNKEKPGTKDIDQRFGAIGRFFLEEFQGDKKVGQFQGRWLADISQIENEQKELEINGRDLLANGVWHSASTSLEKPFCFSQEIYSIGDDIFKVFTYGERDVMLNEPYASHGWKNYYDQERWWEKFEAQSTSF